MRQSHRWIITIAVLVAVLILGLWYKQPKTIREITGIAAPDNIHISIIRFDEQINMEQRKLHLSAGDEGFDALMAQLDQLEFRRPPTNLLYIALPFLTELGESTKEWEDGDLAFQYRAFRPRLPSQCSYQFRKKSSYLSSGIAGA